MASPIPRMFSNSKGKERQFCICPACGQSVLLSAINRHLDSDCKGTKEQDSATLQNVGCKHKREDGETKKSGLAIAEDNHESFCAALGKFMCSDVQDTELMEWRMTLNPYFSKISAEGVIIDLTTDDFEETSTCAVDVQKCESDKSTKAIKLSNASTTHDEEKISHSHSADRVDSISHECVTIHGRNDDMSSSKTDNTPEDGSDNISEDAIFPNQQYPPYYITNFNYIVKSVLDDEFCKDLFDDSDRNVVADFNELTESAQKLYVRLYLRKFDWFRCTKIVYPKIATDLSPIFEILIKKGFLHDESHLDSVEKALSILTASEVKKIATIYHLDRDTSGKQLNTKNGMIQTLLTLTKKQYTIMAFTRESPSAKIGTKMLSRIKSLLGKCVKVSVIGRDVFARIFAMFSIAQYNADEDEASNGQSQIFRLLQWNRGLIKYPNFEVDRTIPIFKSRQELSEYTISMQMEDKITNFIDNKQFEQAYSVYLQAKEKVDYILELIKKDSLKEPCWSFSLPLFTRQFSAEWVYFRICGRSIEVLERLGLYEEAVCLIKKILSQNMYSVRSRGKYWERLSLDTEKYLKKPNEALDLINVALDDPNVRTGHRLALINRAKRICKAVKNKQFKHKLPVDKIEEIRSPREVTISGPIFLDASSSTRTIFISGFNNSQQEHSYSAVEEFTINYYKDIGYTQGIHGEGSTFTFLFALMMWDILFLNIPNVFVSTFQTAPLDLATDTFYGSRRDEINDALAKIRQASNNLTWTSAEASQGVHLLRKHCDFLLLPHSISANLYLGWKTENDTVRCHQELVRRELEGMIDDAWNGHYGEFCIGLNWERFETVEDVKGLVISLGPVVLAGVFELFCKDYRNRCSGIPDLVVWNPSTKKAKIVEVKGPGDRLSVKQIIWLDVFTSLGADVEVCYVKAVGGKRKRLSNNE